MYAQRFFFCRIFPIFDSKVHRIHVHLHTQHICSDFINLHLANIALLVHLWLRRDSETLYAIVECKRAADPSFSFTPFVVVVVFIFFFLSVFRLIVSRVPPQYY